MGCFGGDQPTYTPPAPPTLPTAQELYGQANAYAMANEPMAYGAREGALKDLQNPTSYYSSFQPTSFEQALANQQFQNIWPNQEAYMQNLLSKSGMAYSPVEATTLGNAYGNLSTNIGEYLNTQADNRANQSLMARLGIDPNSITSPYVQTGMNQGNAQANLQYGYQQAQAQQQYQQQMNQYQQQQNFAKLLGQISPVGGAIYGASTGSLGSALSGTMDSVGQVAPYAMAAMTGGASGVGSMVGNAAASNATQAGNNGTTQVYGNSLPTNPFGG